MVLTSVRQSSCAERTRYTGESERCSEYPPGSSLTITAAATPQSSATTRQPQPPTSEVNRASRLSHLGTCGTHMPYNIGTTFLYQEDSMTISASEARQRLFPLLEQVNNDHEPVRIASRSGDAVLMSAADYDSWQETVYLLRSPENARRLMEAVARDKADTSSVSTSIDDLTEMAGGQE